MINRTSHYLLLRPGLRSDFRDSYAEFPQEFDNFLHVGSTTRPEIEATTISGLPRQVPLGEGEPYTIMEPVMAPKVTYRDTQFGLGFGVTQEMIEDDQYSKAFKSAKWLGRSTRLAQEYEAADLLDDAFTGTEFTGFNGEPLISATHTFLGVGGTWSNLVAGNPQLGTLGMQAAYEAAESSSDQMGAPSPINLDKLIIGVSDQWMADQLIQNRDEPFTSDRNINTLRRKGLSSFFISHYKSQANNAWFMQDSRMHDAHFVWRIKPQFPDWYEEMVRTWYYVSRQRFLVYFYDPRGWIGSNAA